MEVLGGCIKDGDHVIIDTMDREAFTFRMESPPVAQPA